MSPLDPRVEVRYVGDQELDAILRELVEPSPAPVQSEEIRRAIRDELGVHVDGVRVSVAMDRVLEAVGRFGPAGIGIAFGKLRRSLTAHQRVKISRARRLDEATAALPRPAPALTLPGESVSEMIDRLLG